MSALVLVPVTPVQLVLPGVCLVRSNGELYFFFDDGDFGSDFGDYGDDDSDEGHCLCGLVGGFVSDFRFA